MIGSIIAVIMRWCEKAASAATAGITTSIARHSRAPAARAMPAPMRSVMPVWVSAAEITNTAATMIAGSLEKPESASTGVSLAASRAGTNDAATAHATAALDSLLRRVYASQLGARHATVGSVRGLLQDQVQLAAASLAAYDATGTPRYLDIARELATVIERDYADPVGGYFDTAESEVPAPALVDLIGGQVQVMCTSPLPAMPHVKSGRLRALGMTGRARSRAAPEVPTVAEQVVPGYVSSLWYALLAPAATPQPIIKRVHAETVRALKSPEVRGQLLAQGAEPIGGSPQELRKFVAAEIDRWTKVIERANIRVD